MRVKILFDAVLPNLINPAVITSYGLCGAIIEAESIAILNVGPGVRRVLLTASSGKQYVSSPASANDVGNTPTGEETIITQWYPNLTFRLIC